MAEGLATAWSVLVDANAESGAEIALNGGCEKSVVDDDSQVAD